MNFMDIFYSDKCIVNKTITKAWIVFIDDGYI